MFGVHIESSCCLWSIKTESLFFFLLFHIAFSDSSGFTKAEEVPTRGKDTGTIIWLFTSPVPTGFELFWFHFQFVLLMTPDTSNDCHHNMSFHIVQNVNYSIWPAHLCMFVRILWRMWMWHLNVFWISPHCWIKPTRDASMSTPPVLIMIGYVLNHRKLE